MKRTMIRHLETLCVVIGCGILFSNPGSGYADPANGGEFVISSPTGLLFDISANGELGQALCFGKKPWVLDEVWFKGPSGVKIRVKASKDENSLGNTTEFSHACVNSVFKVFMSTVFYEKNLPIPVIYTINGVVIAGLGDGGSKEKDLTAAVQKEFASLPGEFRQGLREFHAYSGMFNKGLFTMAASLSCIFGRHPEAYRVEYMVNTNPLDIQEFKSEFKCD